MYSTRVWILSLCLLLAPALTACGSGGGRDVVDPTAGDREALTVPSHPDADGVVDVSGFLAFRLEECFSYTGDLEASYRPGYCGRPMTRSCS